MFFKRKQRYSIRKFKIGVCSVFLGSLLVGTPLVFAESEEQGTELTTIQVNAPSAEENNFSSEATISEGIEVAEVNTAGGSQEGNTPETELTEPTIASPVVKTVDKADLRDAVARFESLANEVRYIFSTNKASYDQALEIAETLLANDNASQEEVNRALQDLQAEEQALNGVLPASELTEEKVETTEGDTIVSQNNPATSAFESKVEEPNADKKNDDIEIPEIEARDAKVESDEVKASVDNEKENQKDEEKPEETFEIVGPGRFIPVVDINQLKESEKERVRNLILKLNKSLSEDSVNVTDTGDVYITVQDKEYYLPASDIVEPAADLVEGTYLRIGETGSFNQAFGYHNNKYDVPGVVKLDGKRVSYDNKGNATITYTVIFNSKQGKDARGKFYVATADYARLGRVTANEVSGGLIAKNFTNPAPNEHINSTVYNKMNAVENTYYKGLTKITTADYSHLNYILEGTNPSGKAYRATIQVHVNKADYERNGNKVYTAFGITTLTNGPSSSNRVRFEETKLNFTNNQPSATNRRTLPKDYTLQGSDPDTSQPQDSQGRYPALWHLPSRPKDPGFYYSSEENALIYRYAIGEHPEVEINSNDLLNLLTAKPKEFDRNSTDPEINRYFIGKDKVEAEGKKVYINPPRNAKITKKNETYYYNVIDPKTKRIVATVETKVLDLVQPVAGKLWGGRVIDTTGSEEGDDGVRDKEKYNRIDNDFTISADKNNGKGSASWVFPGLIRGKEGTNDIANNLSDTNNNESKSKAIAKLQLYLRKNVLSAIRPGINPDTEIDNLNVFVVPVDVTKPRVVPETAKALSVPESFKDLGALTKYINDNKGKISGKDNFSMNANLGKNLKVYNDQGEEVDFDDLVPSMTYNLKAVVTDEAGLDSTPVDISSFIFKPIDAEPIAKKVVSDTEVPADTKVLNPNQEGAKITSSVVSGLKVNNKGNLQGTPNVTFAKDEDSKDVTIPVTLTKEGKTANVNVTVTVNKKVAVTPIPLEIPNGVQIPTGTKAVTANQSGVYYIPLNAGDGFNLTDQGMLEGTPNVTFEAGKDSKVFEIIATANKGEHGAAGARIPVTVYRPLEVTPTTATVINSVETQSNTVISHNQQSGATITADTVNGLTVNAQGKLVGTPAVDFTEDETEKTITIPVTVTKGSQTKTENVTVTVRKKYELTAVPTAIEAGVAIPRNTVVVKESIPSRKITQTEKTDGLFINRYGQLGGPATTTFTDDEDSKVVTIRVSGHNQNYGPAVEVDVPITVYKPLAGTPSTASLENGVSSTTAVTEPVLKANQNGVTITSNSDSGLSLDNAGRLTGTPNVTFEENEDHKVVTLKATVSKADRESKQVDVPITVYKPLAGTPSTASLENGVSSTTAVTEPVLKANQNGVTITSNSDSGLSLDNAGRLTGTPNVTFEENEDHKVVTLKATVSKA
ncbi:YSIRK-type signal peptide-containing protein, partial [Aerococcaceae bacterium zg-ZJ1578]|uniref:YSIRK-type signal peptide-containing protein n=1 Tax=Aerococcaceae bacterium zg-252 TaxID=2796928 RepID=UPI001A2FC881|nr:YSIRK-type signal peptide-containing protein [Aerococcaceae bacterium zg-1578]